MIKGVNKARKTIDDKLVNIQNMEYFHYRFLETKYELEYFRHKRNILQEEFTKADFEYEIELQQKAEYLQKTVISLRIHIKRLYDTNKKWKASFDERIKNDPIYFINHFIITQDPRLKSQGLSPKLPLIMYPSQKKAINDLMKAWKQRMGVATEKSRGEGGTEIYAAFTVWAFITQTDIEIAWGSRIRDSVDKKGEPNCIFERMRRMIDYLPKEMTKNLRKNDDKIGLIKNRLNNTTIIGGGGVEMARGDRAAFGFVDEFSAIEDQNAVLAAVVGITETTVLLTTPRGRDAFYNEKESKGRIKTTLGWWMNPSKNKSYYTNEKLSGSDVSYWYENEKEQYNQNVARIEQELNISYDSYIDDPVIPSLWVNAAINLKIPNPKQGKVKVAGLDISAGKHDATTLAKKDGNLCKEVIEIHGVTTPIGGARKAGVICTNEGYTTVVYDQNAYGEDVPELKSEMPNIEWIGEKGQRSPSSKFTESGERASEKYMNRRAEIYFDARKTFEKTFLHVTGAQKFPFEELISIPDDPVLIADLTTPRIIIHKEKMGVQSKKEIKKELKRSPDKGDAFVLMNSINKSNSKNTVLNSFDYENGNVIQEGINTDVAANFYGCLYLTDTMQLFITIGMWSRNNKKMVIFFSKQYDNFDLKSIKKELLGNFPNVIRHTKWFGNKLILETAESETNSLFSQFARIGMPVREAYTLNYVTHLKYINGMFSRGQLKISSDCVNLLNHIQYLSFDKNGIEEKYILGLTLIILIAGFKPECYEYE